MEKIKEGESQKREDAGARRGRKVAIHCVYLKFVALEGRKVTSLKRRVRSHLARWEMKKCTPLWREAHFQVKMYKTHNFWTLLEVEMSQKCTPLWREAHFQVKMCKTRHSQTTFGSWDVEKCRPLWLEAHFGPLFDVQMSKKCTRVWREAHVQVKSVRNWRVRTTLGRADVEKVDTD